MEAKKSNLRILRKSNNISIKDLAKKLKLAESTIYLYETGKRETDYQTLIEISKIFDVSIDYLLGNTKQTNTSNENVIKIIGKDGRTKEIKVSENKLKAIEALLDNNIIY